MNTSLLHAPIAVIDMGTNTFLLLIADIDQGKLLIRHREQQFVRLGKGGMGKRHITAAAIERGIATLRHYQSIVAKHAASPLVAVATSALRNADNKQEVVNAFVEAVGIRPIIIDGQVEAQLIYEGIRHSLPSVPERVMAMDIGGGSVEFIIGERDEILWKRSFEIGAQRLYDLFFLADPLPEAQQQAMKAYLKEQLQPLKAAWQELQPKQFIGSAGTFDTLWDLKVGKVGDFPAERRLSKREFGRLQEKLFSHERAFRQSMPGMIEQRVDLIVVASSLVRYVFEELAFWEVLIATGALKEGVFFRLAHRKSITEV